MSTESVTISVDGQQIKGKLYVPAGEPKPLAALFLHGWTGRPNDRAAEALVDQGYYAMTFSMRGHADSDGDIDTISRQDSLADALAAYDFFKSNVPDGIGIVLVGNSYGGYISAITSTERAVAALSLRVPAPYPDDGFDGPYRGYSDPAVLAWRRQVHGYAENRSFTAVHDFTGPIQIIEAELDDQLDDLVSQGSVQNYVRAVSDPNQLEYHFMKGWPHSLGDDPLRNTEFQKILLNWLQQIADKV